LLPFLLDFGLTLFSSVIIPEISNKRNKEAKEAYSTALGFRNSIHYAGNVLAAAPPGLLACFQIISAMNKDVWLDVRGSEDKGEGNRVGKESTYCRYRKLLLCTSWVLIAG
jgi:hypothetical protein